MHQAHGLDPGGAGIEIALLALDAVAHGGNHAGVLAAQAAQLGHLVVQVAAADIEHALHLDLQLLHIGPDSRLQHLLALAHDALGQHVLEHGQPAGLQQRLVAGDLGHQALLCRHGQHPLHRQAQHLGRFLALALQLGLHLRRGAEAIPQRIYLVEHHQTRIGQCLLARRRIGRQHMVAPDGQVGLGHAGIGRQHEDHGMGLGDEVDGQLGLGTHGIQAGRIQNDQPLLEQGMGHVDQRVAPHGHLHQALLIHEGIAALVIVMPEAPGSRQIHRHLAHLGHLGQRVGNLLGIVHIQRQLQPGLGPGAPLAQAFQRFARIDGQQAQAGLQLGFPAQLGGAHGRAPCAGRHEAAAIVGEEDRIDQLGLAARELGHEGHHDLVATHLGFQPLQPLLHRDIQQLLGLQPFAQRMQLLRKAAAPCAVLVELLVE